MGKNSKKLKVFPIAIGPEPNYSSVYPLGSLLSYAKKHNNGSLLQKVDFGAVSPANFNGMVERLDQGKFTDNAVYLFSSYVWNYRVQVVFARLLKERFPNALIIVGGPHVPKNEKKCRDFLHWQPCFDIAVNGEGEDTLVALLNKTVDLNHAGHSIQGADYSDILGITFRAPDGQIIQTESRPRLKDLSVLPSPYLTGEFNHWPESFFQTGIIVETNRGCPFGCTFCDWGGATLSKVYPFDIQRVFSEIEFIGERKGKVLHFCDANFGAFQRDIDIAKKIAQTKKETGYPIVASVTFSKNASKRVAEIVRIFAENDLLESAAVSLQTVDDKVLKAVDRSNIKTSSYENLIKVFNDLNMPTATDIMIGLPEQTYTTFKNDLQFCFDRKLFATVFLSSILPNAPMADDAYMEKYNLKFDHRYNVISSSTFTEEERNLMISLRLAEAFMVQEKVFKYVLVYLQVEYDLRALDIVDAWLKSGLAYDDRYPLTKWTVENILKIYGKGSFSHDWLMIYWGVEAKIIFDNLMPFYLEILQIIEENFSISINVESSEIKSLLNFQIAIMPNPKLGFPPPLKLAHNVIDYFKQFSQVSNINKLPDDFKYLREFPSSTFTLPEQKIRKRFSYSKRSLRMPGWPLSTNLPI